MYSTEKNWYTDECENTFRTPQIKHTNTHSANQVNQYKSTSNIIQPIREVEEEPWSWGQYKYLHCFYFKTSWRWWRTQLDLQQNQIILVISFFIPKTVSNRNTHVECHESRRVGAGPPSGLKNRTQPVQSPSKCWTQTVQISTRLNGIFSVFSYQWFMHRSNKKCVLKYVCFDVCAFDFYLNIDCWGWTSIENEQYWKKQLPVVFLEITKVRSNWRSLKSHVGNESRFDLTIDI